MQIAGLFLALVFMQVGGKERIQPDLFGASLAGLGDCNGDGHADLLVGSPRSADRLGSAFLLSGKDGSVMHRVAGDEPGGYFAITVRAAGDRNRDGTPDFAA